MSPEEPGLTEADVKCLSCNAPTRRTADATFVCVDCGNAIVAPNHPSAPGLDSETPKADACESQTSALPSRLNTDGGFTTANRLAVPDSFPSHADGELHLPAIGLVVSDGWSDSGIRTVLRARRRGHMVFLTHVGPADDEFLEAVERLGATVLEPEGDLDESQCVGAIERASRELSIPGVVIQTDLTAPIDLDRSIEALDADRFTVGAILDDRRFGGVQSLDVFVAIPAHNEAATITDVVRSVKSRADGVIVIDDGSTDDTAALAESAGAEVVKHERNAGYGAAIKTAFRVAADRPVEHLIVLDGDAQHDPADIPRLVEPLRNGEANIVIGSRLVEGSNSDVPLYRRFGIQLISVLMNLSTGNLRPSRFIKDTQSGFRAYDRSAFETLAEEPAISDDMDASVDILYHAHARNYEITEIGTTVRYDVENPSSQHPVVHGYRVVRSIIGTVERKRPITTLALPGLLSLSAGVGLGYPVLLSTPSSISLWVAIASILMIVIGFAGCLAAAVLHAFNLTSVDLVK